MMMAAEIRIEPGSLPWKSKYCNQTQVFEPPDRSVDRIHRYRRHSLAHTLKDFFYIGVVASLCNFPENFHALVG